MLIARKVSELTRTPSCVVLVPRGFIPSALVCPSLCSSTILHTLILNGLALSVHYHRLVTRFSQIFRLSTFFSVTAGELGNDDLSSTSASFTEILAA